MLPTEAKLFLSNTIVSRVDQIDDNQIMRGRGRTKNYKINY